MAVNFEPQAVSQLNDFSTFLKFVYTWDFKKMIHCEHKKIALFTGNQKGKTAGAAYQYVLRVLGMHPVPEKNVVYFECAKGHKYSPNKSPVDGKCEKCGETLKQHERGSRTFRFCSETLPGQSKDVDETGKSAEVKNTQYPEFKKWLPPFLIKADITIRNPAMTIKDPFGGADIIVEFVSYNQAVQGTAGVQRLSIWLDEEAPPDFYEEQLPRVIAEDGDMIMTVTPANRITWLYDQIFERAQIYYRTKAICDFLNKGEKKVEMVETTDSPLSIAVIQAATDDNPTLSAAAIESAFSSIDDPDVYATRRYGIFRQVSGRIFKDFDYAVHCVDGDKLFPDGLPAWWVFARGIDYHPQTPWAVSLLAISPTDEVFVFGELQASPETYTIREISREIAGISGDYPFRLSLVDPLSEANKKDGVSVLDDLNKYFRELRAEGLGAGGFWRTWNTKGERGREVIRMRLKNSRRVERPFNNRVVENGQVKYLPTLWIFNKCKWSAKFMQAWRWEEWTNSKMEAVKDKKNAPQQKWSHFNMVLEAIFKEASFRPGTDYANRETGSNVEPNGRGRTPRYFQGSRV